MIRCRDHPRVDTKDSKPISRFRVQSSRFRSKDLNGLRWSEDNGRSKPHTYHKHLVLGSRRLVIGFIGIERRSRE